MMKPFSDRDSYPLEFLPAIILNAVLDTRQITKAPTALIAASVLGAAATACQGLADVRRPTISTPVPLSLNFLTIAESGERKSAADSLCFAPIYAFEKAKRSVQQEAFQAFDVDVAIWSSKAKALQNRITKAASKGLLTSELERELREAHSKRPLEPSRKRIVLSDITPSAISAELARNPCTATLHSNEAADLIRGRALGNLPLLNRVWDGQPIEVDRRDSSESIYVENARMTTVLAVQPDSFKQMCEGNDSHARHSGYLARALIAYPESTAGQREMGMRDGEVDFHQGLQVFQMRIQQLLELSFERHAQDRPRRIISFTPDAKLTWIQFFNDVEGALDPNFGRFRLIKDFSAKAAEHVARLAAIFEILNGDSEFITDDTVRRSIEIVTWHLYQFDKLFGATRIQNEVRAHADTLLQWMRGKSAFASVNGNQFSRRKIMQFGPKAIRKSEMLDPVIDELIKSGEARWSDFIGKNLVLADSARSAFPEGDLGFTSKFDNIFSANLGLVAGDCFGVISTQPKGYK